MFARLIQGVAPQEPSPACSMIAATQRKVHRTATSLRKNRDVCRWIGCTTGGLQFTLHGVCDGSGRPIRILLTQGHVSDDKGARQLLPQ